MNTKKILYVMAVAMCAMPFVDTAMALLMGIVLAQFIRYPFIVPAKNITHFLLQASVVGLGFGMNIGEALDAGKQGLLFTIFSILITITLGLFIGRKLKIDNVTSYLISTGTAICGGSAIAAVTPIANANEKQISTALGTVFILNSVALFLFPVIGHALHLTQEQFGIWAAIAIHDTSSVVGAASRYGNEALHIATTIKLERALWIVPVSLLSILFFRDGEKRVSIPYFILLFVGAMLINTFVPFVHEHFGAIITLSKIGLKITLFLIGTGLTKDLITSVGIKPFIQGIVLWIFISTLTLTAIYTIL